MDILLNKPVETMKSGIIKASEVEYDCIMLDEKSIDTVKNVIESSNIFGTIIKNGINVPNLTMQRGMHCTLRYFGFKKDSEQRALQLTNKEYGTQVDLVISGLGVYVKDGQIMNVGLLVDKDKSANVDTLSDVRASLFGNSCSHVTVAINKDAGAKAVETTKCFDEGAYTVMFSEPLTLTGKIMAAKGDKEAEQIVETPSHDLPRREKDSRPEIDVMSNSGDSMYKSLGE